MLAEENCHLFSMKIAVWAQVLSFAPERMGSEMNFYCWVGVEVVQRWEAVAV